MPEQKSDIDEILRLQEINQILEAQEKQSTERPQVPMGLVNQVNAKILGGVDAVSTAIDKVNPIGAPFRAGVGAVMDTGGKLESFGKAYANQYIRPQNAAPSPGELAAKAGVSTQEYETPLVVNPFTQQKLKVSPAGVVGGLAATAIDPTTYMGRLPAKGIGLVGDLAEDMAGPLAKSVARQAELRAAKAGTGQNISAIRKMAKSAPGAAADLDKAEKGLRNVGKTMLEADDSGGPLAALGNRPKVLAPAAAEKRDFYGKEIGKIGGAIDSKTADNWADYGSYVSGDEIAKKLEAYAETIPQFGDGERIANRVRDEANKFKGTLLPFEAAQESKNQFKFKATSSDALIANQDATNTINRIISKEMDDTVEKVLSKEDLAKYKAAKDKYGTYKQIAEAASARAEKELSNRFFSPTDYATGGAGLMLAIAQGAGGLKTAAITAGAAAAHKLMRERGSMWVARTANQVAKAIEAAPEKFQKWVPALEMAAARGAEAMVATNHILMENDKEYRKLMRGGEEPKEGPRPGIRIPPEKEKPLYSH